MKGLFHVIIVLLVLTVFFSITVSGQKINIHFFSCETNSNIERIEIKDNKNKSFGISDASGNVEIELSQLEYLECFIYSEEYRDTVIIIYANSSSNIELCLRPRLFKLNEFVVTANRFRQKVDEIPARVESINQGEIQKIPVISSDEILTLIPGVVDDRKQGYFSKNASITMRGINGSGRSLVLYNGIPLNKADGGGVNWNLIQRDRIDHVEILKGPASSIYGGNAMAGVINVFSKKPDSLIEVNIESSVGGFGLFQTSANLASSTVKNDTGFYYEIGFHAIRGNGYNPVAEVDRVNTDTTMFVREIGGHARIGYSFGKGKNTEMEYLYFDDSRGEGKKVFENLGTYNKYSTHLLRNGSNYKIGKGTIVINSYYLQENYYKQNESKSSKTGKYKLFDTQANRDDIGVFLAWKSQISKKFSMISGIDFKSGQVKSNETYYTSSDIFRKSGKMDQYAIYSEWNGKVLNSKLIISGGLRMDFAWFRNGSFLVITPSSQNVFMNDFPIEFNDHFWKSLSPKIGLRFPINNRNGVYASYSKGFRPPMLDDMCTNRSVNKGFKMANPNLDPEKVHNFEIGSELTIRGNWFIQTSLYYYKGVDFQYFVYTGDSIDVGSDAMKAVLFRDNIAEIKNAGLEFHLHKQWISKLRVDINYAYNYPFISSFANSKYENKELEGKMLMEVPRHNFNTSLTYHYKKFFGAITYFYKSKQWYDDENTIFTPSYDTFNAKIGVKFYQRWYLSLTIQDLLNQPFLDNNGYWSPGRYFLFSMNVLFTKTK